MDKPAKKVRAPATAPKPVVIYHLGLRLRKCKCKLTANPDLCCAKHRILQGQPPCINGYVCDRCLGSENVAGYERYRVSSAKADFSKALKSLPAEVVDAYVDEIKARYGWTLENYSRDNTAPDDEAFEVPLQVTTWRTPVPQLTVEQVTVIQTVNIHDMPWQELKLRIKTGALLVPAPLLALPVLALEEPVADVFATPDSATKRKRPKPEGWKRVKIPPKYADVDVSEALHNNLPDGPGNSRRVEVFLPNGEAVKMTRDMFMTLRERDLERKKQRDNTPTRAAESVRKRTIEQSQHSDAALTSIRATTAPSTIVVAPTGVAGSPVFNVTSPSKDPARTTTVRVQHNTRARHQTTSAMSATALQQLGTPDHHFQMNRFMRDQCRSEELTHPDPTVTHSPDTPTRQYVEAQNFRMQQVPMQGMYWGNQYGVPPNWSQERQWSQPSASNVFKHPAQVAGGMYYQQPDPAALRRAKHRREMQEQERTQQLFRQGDRSVMKRKLVERQELKHERRDSFAYPFGTQGYAEEQQRKMSAAISQVTEAEDADDVIYTRTFSHYKFNSALPTVWRALDYATPMMVIDDDRSAGLRPVASAVTQYYGLPIKANMSQRLQLTFTELYQRDDVDEIGTAQFTDINHVSATPYAAPHGDTTLTSVNPLVNKSGPDWLVQPTDNATAAFTWKGTRVMGMTGLKGFRIANHLTTVAEAFDNSLQGEHLSDNTKTIVQVLLEMICDNAKVSADMYAQTVVQQRDFLLMLSGKKFTKDELRDLRYYAPNQSDSVFPRALFGGPGDLFAAQPVPAPPDLSLMRERDVDIDDDVAAFENIDVDAEEASIALEAASPPAALATSTPVAATATAVRPTATITPSTPIATPVSGPEPMDIGQVAAQVAGIPGAGPLQVSASNVDNIIQAVAHAATATPATPAPGTIPAIWKSVAVSSAAPACSTSSTPAASVSGDNVVTTASNVQGSQAAATPVVATTSQKIDSQSATSAATAVRLPDAIVNVPPFPAAIVDVASSDVTASDEEEEQAQSDTEAADTQQSSPVFRLPDGLSDEEEEQEDVADTEEVVVTSARLTGKAGSMYQAMKSPDN